jgi:MAF protein
VTEQPQIILASGSRIRAEILRSHNIKFEVVKPGVDESVIKTEGAKEGLSLEATAMRLAEAKCMAVAKSHSGLVIGSDQILEFEDRAFDKPADMAEAKARLSLMQGHAHSLINATAVARNGEIVWRNLACPRLTMRGMTGAQIDAYLENAGDEILSSVGAYQVETPLGEKLFERISGDRFAVMGLALYPVLDCLRRKGAFGDAAKDPKPVRAGVVGSPIKHSLSPMIHNTWAQRAFVNGTYEAIEVAPGYDAFAEAMDRLRAEGFAGVNVTLPHKENALRYATTASRWAQTIGAANTLTFTDMGVQADNSDGPGLLTALSQTPVKGDPVRVLILGAGGAARAAAVALKSLTAGDDRKRHVEVFIANRTLEKAQTVAQKTGATAIPWERRSDFLATINLLVNTTSLGMKTQPPLDIDLGELPKDAVVFDAVYAPLETPLLKAARARGNAIVSGLDMLMWQATPGFSYWFGENWPYRVSASVDDDLRNLLVAELKRRGDA